VQLSYADFRPRTCDGGVDPQEDRQTWLLCPDVAPFNDNRFGYCDLLQRSIIRYGATRKAVATDIEAEG
jgi:hypothetical protein